MKTLSSILIVALSGIYFPTAAQVPCASFGNSGIGVSLESHTTYLSALTVLPNGKIVAVGYYDDNTDKDFLVVRYNANGTPDHGFANNGVRIYDLSDGRDDEALCVSIASDGNLLIGGISNEYGTVIKINSNGSLVNSFGSNGVIKYETLYSTVEDILVNPQGNFYTVGKTFNTANIVIRKLRIDAYNASGSLINSFAEEGKYIDNDFEVKHNSFIRGALQPDGKIVVGGAMEKALWIDLWKLVRLNTDGTRDQQFGTDGRVEVPEDGTAMLRDLVVESDGAIYAAGFAAQDAEYGSFAIAKKFRPNGNSDNSFNMTGSAHYLLGGDDGVINAIAVSNGAVYLVGSTGEPPEAKSFLFGAFDPAGETDSDLGWVIDKIPGAEHGELLDLIRLSDGSFVACGYAVGKDHTYGILRKYGADGKLLNNFNEGGALFIRMEEDAHANAIAVQPDGKLIAGGPFLNGGSNTGLSLSRFDRNGKPDQSFGTYGYIRHDLSDKREFITAVHALSDGKILIGGYTGTPSSGDDYLIMKLNADGKPDQSFGDGGKVVKHIGAYAKHNQIKAITVDSQGRILIAGDANFRGGSYNDAVVMRFLANGSVDNSFGADGVFKIELSVINNSFNDIIVSSDGSIFVAGSGVNTDGVVVKITDEGDLDESFGTDGIAMIPWTDTDHLSHIGKIRFDLQGRIVAGCSYVKKNASFTTRVFVARLLSSGSLDQTFGNGGRALPAYSGSKSNDKVGGLVINEEGSIFLSGYYSPDGRFFFLQKFNENGSPSGLYTSKNFTSESDLVLGPTGTLYAAIELKQITGSAVICLGKGGGDPQPGGCANLNPPTIQFEGDVLIASAADTYQWYKSGVVLAGETGQSLVINPAFGGVYNVEVTVGECTLTSEDFLYLVTSYEEEKNGGFRVYPNPTQSSVIVQGPHDFHDTSITVHSAIGTAMNPAREFHDEKLTLSFAGFSPGVYVLSISSNNQTHTFKLIKQ